MLVGLQGSGKTTQAAKLALRLKEQGRRSLLIAADVYRPAAIDQLKTLEKQIGLPVYEAHRTIPCASRAMASPRRAGFAFDAIVDTAGRLQIDEALMEELAQIKTVAQPREILLVADAMTGQEATSVAKGFHDRLGITGVISRSSTEILAAEPRSPSIARPARRLSLSGPERNLRRSNRSIRNGSPAHFGHGRRVDAH